MQTIAVIAGRVDEEPLRAGLLAGAREGRFLEAVYASSRAEREQRDDLSRELVALHNEGLVDVVKAFGGLKNEASGGPDFFLTRHVFEQALPLLSAPVGSVMRCVLSLCREAGRDMAAGTIFNSYIEFCAKDEARPNEALKLIELEPDALADILAATVAAGSRVDSQYYLSELIRLSRHQSLELRRRAVFSIARVQWPEGATVPADAIAALEDMVATEQDDHVLGGALKSAFALYVQDKAMEERTIATIGSALVKGSDQTLHAASELLWLSAKEMPPVLLQLLLTHLQRVSLENKGTLDNIDYGIDEILQRQDPEDGLQFLEQLLVAHKGKLSMKALDSAAGRIRQSAPLISKTLTRWLVRGERVLCEAVYEVAGTHYGPDLRVEIDASELKPADYAHILFTARKAVGYFFMKPVTAASIVISLMRHAPDGKSLEALGELLFDPLLLNYPGGTRDYVQEQVKRESGAVKEAMQKSLASIDSYLDVLRAVPALAALHPSQTQREAYRRHMSDSMAKSMQAVEKESVLLSLFARSTLLYGNKSINYVYLADGEPRRVETPLTSHGVSIEFPRIDNIDPFGLDYMLRVFRQERLGA
jgi:hypothetical protein